MPDENINCTDVSSALEYLEDCSLENKPARIQNYRVIQSALERDGQLDVKILERILAVCVHDLKEELKYTFIIMNMIPVLLHKIKEGLYNPPLNLMPSALAVMNILNTTALINRVDTLRGICYKTLLSFPDSTLTEIVESNHNEILTMVNLYCHVRVPLEIRLQACNFLYKLLNIIPPDKRKLFIGKGISVWFSNIIPSIMAQMQLHEPENKMPLQLLELLTEDLINYNYSNDESWINVLECICQPDKYPKIMQTLLHDGYSGWCRLWIVFIRLLKHQITQTFGDIGTPINSMLPVVEAAFKVDVANRCKAFQCWNVLIDSFSTETNESNITKRIKLLIIPLKSNNAKTEETALAKFKCWWHLLIQFQSKLDRYLDMILVSFLQFIFGRHNATDKTPFLAGQITHNVKKQTVKAIVELVGHVNCTGCTDLQKLNGKILTTKHLVNNWSHWLYSITTSVTIAAEEEDVLNKKQIKCLWKSFILTIGELPDNNIRKDLFFEILSLLRRLLELSSNNRNLADIVYNILLMSLFDGDPIILELLKTRKGDENPMNETLNILQEPALISFYQSYERRELVTKMRPVTDLVVNKMFNPTFVVGRFMLELPATDTALTLWTALAESVYENESLICIKNLIIILLWPLENLDAFRDVKLAAMAWYKLYILVHPKLSNTDIDEDIMNILQTSCNLKHSELYFKLCALLAHMKCKLADLQFTDFNKEAELLESLTNNVVDYKSIEELVPLLLDVLQLVLHNVTVNLNDTLASCALNCFNNMFKIIIREFNDECNDHIFRSLEHVVRSVEKLLNVESYCKLGSIIITDDLLMYPSTLHGQYSMKDDVLSLLKTVMRHCEYKSEALFSKIEVACDNIENVKTTVDTNENQKKIIESDINKFTTPKSKEVTKKSKKKEPSIVNTVSENGEEYVVVKSNWKFNPRKLTENQKERLKRKREDIPALYQDLSQSQDEFQLATWKTDSQDASSSSRSESKSNAATNEDATTILKNLPSADVVPNIVDNILTKDKDDKNKATDVISNRTEPVTPKNTKSPRMALKDRVVQNVRNLIEKSSVQKNNKESVDQDLSDNITKTPTHAKKDLENKTESTPKTPKAIKAKTADNVINSAPPLISADRPSRVKRKPKKFDDVELLALKRSRHSLHGALADVKTTQTARAVHANKSNETIGTTDNNIKEDKPIKSIKDDSNANQKNEDVIEVHDSDLTVTNPNGNEQVINVDEINEKAQDDKPIDVDDNVEETAVTKCGVNTLNTDKKEEQIAEVNANNSEEVIQEISTPKQSNDKVVVPQKSTAKKNCVKKSRIEKELAIDMVEGHPFLKMQSKKRLTRKNIATTPPTSGRRKGLTEKLNNSKSDNATLAKSNKKNKDKKEIEYEQTSFTVNETQESSEASKDSTPEDLCSEDVIESSQDSTFSTLSVKSAKKSQKKIPLVNIEKLKPIEMDNEPNVSQSILDCGAPVEIDSSKTNHCETKDDSEIPLNKTAVEEKSYTDLTENMDTEPINEMDICDDVIVIENVPVPIVLSSDDTVVGPETQEMAEADTQPVDPSDYIDTSERIVTSQNNITKTLSESACVELQKSTDVDVSSPFKDDDERNKEFFSNTLEISPIKTMSPDRCKKSPSPETSSDYVVIKLTSPVHSNGEPFEKCPSPEFFSDDKVSPDKRDQSPPRVEIAATNNSPSSTLSLKKNRPQVRPGGRAAKMLVLCAPNNLNAIMNTERKETEKSDRCSPSNTAARRNLRIMYTTEHSDYHENPNESEDSESFLKLRRSLPAVDSSPSGPILKRKLIEITDDATISPASKRKRVSFHDPPVSTTVSIQKYIEPGGLRSPQNSAQKRLERQLRQYTVKSPKRLENVFKLDTALTKTLESFTGVVNTAEDTQPSSLDETPTVEIVKAGELNDIDPICTELIECKDHIDNIATELSSAGMKSLLIKELKGKVETVGDLAKMTELEVNRLCIKAPKVKIAKKVLSNYAANKAKMSDATITIDAAMFDETMNEAAPKAVDMDIQTDCKDTCDAEIQAIPVPVACGSMQTEVVPSSHQGVQTNETGEESTAHIIKSCLLKRPDFVEELSEQLQESSIQQMCDKLPFSAMTDVFMKKVTHSNSDAILSRILEQQNMDAPAKDRKNNELYFLQDFIYDRFDSKDMILFCSQLLQRVHDKPS